MTIRLAPITIGPVTIDRPVLLAPMSGVTDLPFRVLAHRLGAGLVISEMIADHDYLNGKAEALARAAGGPDLAPRMVQIAGREAIPMAAAARALAGEGAQIIDINMGCPAKKVTRGLSGSALMRDLDHALRLIEATVKAVAVPVTLKMRLGWDENSLNAPELAARAVEAGVRMITVHGRTRCQFYKGRADWAAIRAVRAAVPAAIPVIANGDIESADDALAALAASRADGVMVGRGAQGRPWFPGQLGAFLTTGTMPPDPDHETIRALLIEQYEGTLALYGRELGVRIARKHLAWTLERIPGMAAAQKAVCRMDDPAAVIAALEAGFARLSERRAA